MNLFWGTPNLEGEFFSDHVVRVIKSLDARAQEKDFAKEKTMEIEGLLKREVWIKVAISSIPDQASIAGGRFVLTLKIFPLLRKWRKYNM